MFFKIYQTTLKNIYRTPIFWMMFVMFGLVALEIITKPFYGSYSMEFNEMIPDTDPRYIVGYSTYVQHVSNTMSGRLLYYAMPLFTTMTTVLVLNRDCGDNFFEIEKAAGMKPAKYVFARLFAIFTLNLIVATIMAYFYLHLYVFTRGGVKNLGLWEYIVDSTVRMMRHILFRAVPTIVFFIGFTYCVGSMFKSGFAAAVLSVCYVGLYCEAGALRYRIGHIYWDYLSYNPEKLVGYFHQYDGYEEEFEFALQASDTNLGKALLCICILVGLGMVYTAIAYLRTRKRDR